MIIPQNKFAYFKMNIAISLIVIFTVSSVIGQPCEDIMSVDLSDGKVISDGTIVKDGTIYPPHLVYPRNVSGEIKNFGCLCEMIPCIRKCCPFGSYVSKITVQEVTCTEHPTLDLLQNKGANLYYLNSFKKNVDIQTNFAVFYGRACQHSYIEDENLYLQEDGKLYIDLPNSIPPWTLKGPDKYCIDTFVTEDPSTGNLTTHIDALICFAETQDNNHYVLSSTCMMISCIFILATIAVYSWLPELRNLHGKVLMVYLMSLFVGFAILATMQVLLVVDNISPQTCIIMTIIIYFALLSGFFWLNVMSFDIWWTFSGKRGPSSKLSSRARFTAYAAYAFGIPSVMTILVTSLEFSGLPPHPLMPMLRHSGCFINGTSKLLYLYGPILILCIANLIFFILTAMKIAQIKKQTSVLKSKESSMHDQHRNDKQRLLLYLKLFAVMGANWIMEVVSSLYPDINDFWKFTDAYNVLIGVIIFIIFVCKRKTFRLIKKRIKERFHQAPSDSIGELTDMRNKNLRQQWKNHQQRASQETIRTYLDSESIKNGVISQSHLSV